jgi:hypothetical protein
MVYELVSHVLRKDKIAFSNFFEILTIANESKKTIEQLQAQDEE